MSLPAGRESGLVPGGSGRGRGSLQGSLLHRQGVQVVRQLPREVRDVRVEQLLRRPATEQVRSGQQDSVKRLSSRPTGTG